MPVQLVPRASASVQLPNTELLKPRSPSAMLFLVFVGRQCKVISSVIGSFHLKNVRLACIGTGCTQGGWWDIEQHQIPAPGHKSIDGRQAGKRPPHLQIWTSKGYNLSTEGDTVVPRNKQNLFRI